MEEVVLLADFKLVEFQHPIHRRQVPHLAEIEEHVVDGPPSEEVPHNPGGHLLEMGVGGRFVGNSGDNASSSTRPPFPHGGSERTGWREDGRYANSKCHRTGSRVHGERRRKKGEGGGTGRALELI